MSGVAGSRGVPADSFRHASRFAVQRVGRRVADFLWLETAGGVALVGATVGALLVANSPWSGAYHDLLETEVGLRVGGFTLVDTIHHWIDDGAMTLFFFVVGLEIKRELVVGQLRERAAAALPAAAALGGVVVPAALFLAVQGGAETSSGWGVPMATDIAFAVGVLALLGSRVPNSLRIFLLSLAIVDDIVAILVIAVFYSDGVEFNWLLAAVGAFGVAAAARLLGLWWAPVYWVLGVATWYAMYRSGVHPTIAGVAFGLLAPARPLYGRLAVPRLTEGRANIDVRIEESRAAEWYSRHSVSIADRLTDQLHLLSSFVVIPLFAFSNAGLDLGVDIVSDAVTSRVGVGILVGLVAGKPLGILAAIVLMERLGLATRPPGTTTRQLVGVAALAGIGFTVSLFISNLAFEDELANLAKLAVLVASASAAAIGCAVLVGSPTVDDEAADAFDGVSFSADADVDPSDDAEDDVEEASVSPDAVVDRRSDDAPMLSERQDG